MPLPDNLQTLHEKLCQVANQVPRKIALQIKTATGYDAVTYQQLLEQSQKVAFGLIALGIKKKDRIGIILENRPEWGIIYFGIMFAGCTAVPIDPQSNYADIEYFLTDSKTKIVFCSHLLDAIYPKLADNLAGLERTIILGKKFSSASVKIQSFENFLAGVLPKELPAVSTDDLASILYTSGTTGKPKGVMLTHENFYANFLGLEEMQMLTNHHNILAILPLHHSFPFMGTLLLPIFSRIKVTYLATLRTDELLQCMRESNITVLMGVPQIYQLFYKKIIAEIAKQNFFARSFFWSAACMLCWLRKLTNFNLAKIFFQKVHQPFGDSLKFFISGGAKLDPKIGWFFYKLGFTILEGYGLTETSPVVAFNPIGDERIGSVGRVLPNVEMKIADPNQDGVGEILIRGPNVTKGYYNNQEETNAVLKDGWFYSGDLGFIKQNYLYITGRKKEIIVLSSGKNVLPEEVETYYAQTRFIKELCVLDVNINGEDKLMAVIVPDFSYYLQVAEINIYERMRWELENYAKNFPAYKRIMGFIITRDDLPRTQLGKLKRYEIREKYVEELQAQKMFSERTNAQYRDAELQLLSSKSAKTVIEVVTKELGLTKIVQLHDHLELDYGVDSLGRIELVAALEKAMQVRVPDQIIAKLFTVKDLIVEFENLQVLPCESVGQAVEVRKEKFSWSEVLQTPLAPKLQQKIALNPGKFAQLFLSILTGFFFCIFKIFWRLQVSGLENIQREQNYIVCINHTSYLDGFLIAAALPRWFKANAFLLAFEAFFTAPIVRNFIKIVKIIPVDSASYLLDAMQASAYVLKNHKSLAIFPEGIRSIDGELIQFKKGIGILAKELNVDILPVFISGAFQAWPRASSFPKLYPIQVTVGKPCRPDEMIVAGKKLGAKDDYEAIALGVRQKIAELRATVSKNM